MKRALTAFSNKTEAKKGGTARKETPVIFNNTGDRYLLNF
jgi:hypothetical protein